MISHSFYESTNNFLLIKRESTNQKKKQKHMVGEEDEF